MRPFFLKTKLLPIRTPLAMARMIPTTCVGMSDAMSCTETARTNLEVSRGLQGGGGGGRWGRRGGGHGVVIVRDLSFMGVQ